MPGLGNKLKLSREKFGLTLEEAGEELNIQKEDLIALEEENFYFLPDKISAQNILERYSGFLGMDTEKVLQEFDKEWSNEGAIKDFIQKTFVPDGEVSDSVPKKNNLFIIAGMIVILMLALVLPPVINRQPEPPTDNNVSQKEVSGEKDVTEKQEPSGGSPGIDEGTENGKDLPAEKENKVSPEKNGVPAAVEPGKSEQAPDQVPGKKDAGNNGAETYKDKVAVELRLRQGTAGWK